MPIASTCCPLSDLALRLIATASAADHPHVAGQLAGYLDARPCEYPLPGPFDGWATPALEAARAAIPGNDLERDRLIGAQLTRRQMLALVSAVTTEP